MKWIVVPLLFVVFGCSSDGGEAKDAGKTFLKDLEGEWKVVVAQKDGEMLPDEATNPTVLVFKGAKLIIRDPAQTRNEERTITIDVNTKPVSIDAVDESIKQRDVGIIDLKGDVLKICIREGGAPGERPTSFALPQKSPNLYMELKRIKK